MVSRFAGIIRQCKTCGKDMKISPSKVNKKVFCSLACRRQNTLSITTNCVVCGKEFTGRIRPNLNTPQCCSKYCRGISWYQRNKIRFTKEYLQRAGVMSCLSQQKNHRSSIEKIVYNELTSRGILFTEQYSVNDKFLVDVFVPSLNLVIECDGDYWHSLDKVIKRDKSKNAYLTKCGFNLLRLPEHLIHSGGYLSELEGALSG